MIRVYNGVRPRRLWGELSPTFAGRLPEADAPAQVDESESPAPDE